MANTNESGIQYLGDANSSGTTLGRSSASLIGFYGATNATRPSGSNQAAITITAGTTDSSAPIASLQSLATANKTLVNELRSALVQLGLIAGA